jgi:BetI-type transcriptional repressor, C-terminal
VLSSSFFDRQVALYQHVLESGAARGAFQLATDANSLARGLVAMEDGLGLQVVVGHPSLDSSEAELILLRHAGSATGVDLERLAL